MIDCIKNDRITFIGIFDSYNPIHEGNCNLSVEDLMNFFKELSKLGAEFGYRTASEITRFLDRIANLEDSTEITDDHLDYAIIQKLLPKLHGSRNKLVKVLEVLGKNCLETPETENKVFTKDISEEDIRFSLSYEKLARMHKNAIDNGFASFAEA